jgi:hypothetical protein
MKIGVTFKDPDGVYESIAQAMAEQERGLVAGGMADDEAEAAIEIRREKVGDALRRWVEYGEYLTVEFDLDAHTATVKEKRA